MKILQESFYEKLKRQKGLWYVLPAGAVALGLIIGPWTLTLSASLSKLQLRNFVPETFVGFYNYMQIIEDALFWRSLAHSAIWAGACVFFQFVLGLIGASILNQRFPGRIFFRIVLFVPWAVPIIVGAMAWKWLYNVDYGYLNGVLTQLGLVEDKIHWLGNPDIALGSLILTAVWRGFPFVMVMLLAGLQSIPRGLYEASEVDGATSIDQFLYITIPLLKPVVIIILLLIGILEFNAFTIVWAMTRGGPANNTLLLAPYIYRKGFISMQFEMAAAGSVIILGIAITFIIGYVHALRTGGTID